jgi:hypothetical protein
MLAKKKAAKAAPKSTDLIHVGATIVVEVPLPDGCLSMFVGRIVCRSPDTITLREASWIAHTGRRSEFFAGVLSGACEVEPYPEATLLELPAADAIVTSWPHPLPRSVR